MDQNKLKNILSDYPEADVAKFIQHVTTLIEEKKDGKPANYWIQNVPEENLAEFFIIVNKEGLVLDGEDIRLVGTWSKKHGKVLISLDYNYQAYKNKMLIAYPETKIDTQLVYEGDELSFRKESGKVIYSHKIKDPFKQSRENIVGGYCIIKNSRGEFLTPLSKDEIEHHRKKAKTDYIWNEWYKEMAMKTLIKKACSKHFKDTFSKIESMDNENYSLDNPHKLDIKFKKMIDEAKDYEELKSIYYEYEEEAYKKGQKDEFHKYLSERKHQILKLNENTNE